jgi:hypothetical protein
MEAYIILDHIHATLGVEIYDSNQDMNPDMENNFTDCGND